MWEPVSQDWGRVGAAWESISGMPKPLGYVNTHTHTHTHTRDKNQATFLSLSHENTHTHTTDISAPYLPLEIPPTGMCPHAGAARKEGKVSERESRVVYDDDVFQRMPRGRKCVSVWVCVCLNKEVKERARVGTERESAGVPVGWTRSMRSLCSLSTRWPAGDEDARAVKTHSGIQIVVPIIHSWWHRTGICPN